MLLYQIQFSGPYEQVIIFGCFWLYSCTCVMGNDACYPNPLPPKGRSWRAMCRMCLFATDINTIGIGNIIVVVFINFFTFIYPRPHPHTSRIHHTHIHTHAIMIQEEVHWSIFSIFLFVSFDLSSLLSRNLYERSSINHLCFGLFINSNNEIHWSLLNLTHKLYSIIPSRNILYLPKGHQILILERFSKMKFVRFHLWVFAQIHAYSI